MQDKASYSDFIQSLFDELKRMEIEYCVERNYEKLPYYAGNDVDILVQKDQLHELHNILLEVGKLSGWTLITKAKSYGGSRYYFAQFGSMQNTEFDVQSDNPPHLHAGAKSQIALLHIDITFKKNWKALEFASAKHVLAGRKPYNTFYIPSAGAEAAISLLTRLIHHGYVKEAYKERIRSLVGETPNVFGNIIRESFGQKSATDLLERIGKSDWDGIESKTSALRHRLLFRALFRHPVEQMFNWLNYVANRLQRFFNPVGSFVVLLGPDGSGKSSVANQLVLMLKPFFQTGRSRILHWRPGLLPPIHRLFGRRNNTEEDFTQPHRAKPHSHPISLARFLYYTTDFILGYYSKVHFMKAKGMLVIIDRYYYDFLVDAYRYRLDLPDWFFRLFLKVIPRPDMVFYLHCSPEIIRERKKELPVEELNRQVDEFQKLLHKLPNSIGVDANRPLCKVVNEVKRTLLDSAVRRANHSK